MSSEKPFGGSRTNDAIRKNFSLKRRFPILLFLQEMVFQSWDVSHPHFHFPHHRLLAAAFRLVVFPFHSALLRVLSNSNQLKHFRSERQKKQNTAEINEGAFGRSLLCFEEKPIRGKCGIFCRDAVILRSAQLIHFISILHF